MRGCADPLPASDGAEFARDRDRRTLRVLYVCADLGIPLDGTKGASIHVRQTIESLARSGVEVHVLSARPGRWAASAPDRVRVLESPPIGVPSDRERRALALAARLPDAVPETARYDVVYERASLWSVAAVRIAERLGIPAVVEMNAPLVAEQQRYRSLRDVARAREIERTLARRAHALMCVSPPLIEHAARLRGNRAGVHLVPNSVDTSRFFPEDRDEGTDRAVRFAFVGSLKSWHGVDTLVEAFLAASRCSPGIELHIVGDGPERRALEDRVARANSARVAFHGAVPHDAIPETLRRMDVGVAPYPRISGFYFSPLKVGEYLATGLPVIASACGELPDRLADGENAALVSPDDVEALAGAIERLAGDSGERRRLGRNARVAAEREWSLDTATGFLVDRLRKLSERAETTPGPPT